MNRPDYLHILDRGLPLKGFFFLIVAIAMLIALATFGLKYAYEVHTQP